MLGEFVLSILGLVFGYVYPAVECFKTIERSRSRSDTQYLLFWCQYWVILALLTAIEKFGDMFISWLPLYGECKLAFIVYLWHPRTRGTLHVYETLLRPFMEEHEMDIERRLQLIMSKSIDLFLFYIKNFADKGQSMAFEILQYIISLPSRTSGPQNADRPSAPQAPRSRHKPSAPPPMPPRHPVETARSTDDQHYSEEEEMQTQVNRVEEALRAAGVNLRRLRQQQQ